jgi:type IV pilus assembly protein PilC
MTTFRYRARSAGGELVSGTLSGSDAAGVLASLRSRALVATAIAPERRWTIPLPSPFGRGLSPRARTAFFRCLATLVRAGVPLRRALEVAIARGGDRRLRASLQALQLQLDRGVALSDAMRAQSGAYSPIVVAMIAAGEAGGVLDDVLARIATFLERDEELRKRLLGALAYPATVLVAALLLVGFLLARVVPMFSAMFASFHVPLPPSTRLLLALGDLLASPGCWLALGALSAGGVLAGFALGRRPEGRRTVDRLRLRIPVVGPLVQAAILSRSARMLGTLVHVGVDLSTALGVIGTAAGSPLHAEHLERTARAIAHGETLASAFDAAGALDPMFVTLVAVGEDTGMLDDLLLKAADYFDADVAATIAVLSAVIEPALILFLGLVVGLIVSSVFVPLYSLIGSVSQ